MSNWDSAAEDYARSFAKLCAGAIPAVLGAVVDAPGRHLLDAGCGTGELAGSAHDAGFDVIGVDSAREMLAVASARHPGIRFTEGDLLRLPFPAASFDAVTANFVVNHTPDPRGSLRELRRVLVAGGVSAVTVWPYRASELNMLWGDVIARSGAIAPPIVRLPPEKDFERTVAGLTSLLVEAGFDVAAAHEFEVSFDVAPDDLWAGAEAGMARIGAAYLAQDFEMRRAMTASFRELIESRSFGGLLTFTSTALMATGRNR